MHFWAARRGSLSVLAQRMGRIELIGIRRIFGLMTTMEDPIHLSIGQAHYGVRALNEMARGKA